MKLHNCLVFLILCKIHIISSSRISEEKCEEYSKLFPSKGNTKKRDISADLFAIIFNSPPAGKVKTELGEFPHMAHLGVDHIINDTRVFFCGGVLISDQYILTSATCTRTKFVRIALNNERDKMSLNIKNGTQFPIKYIQLGNNKTGIEEFSPEQIIVYPEYHNEFSIDRNNIGLIKLNKKVEFTEHIRPACLYSDDEVLTNKTVIGTGWGRTSFDSDFSQDLQKVDLDVFSRRECNKFYTTFSIEENDMCVGHRSGSNTLCGGDGGAPLQIKNKKFKNMYDIVGIVSMYYSCNLEKLPIYASKVKPYISWIENIVWGK